MFLVPYEHCFLHCSHEYGFLVQIFDISQGCLQEPVQQLVRCKQDENIRPRLRNSIFYGGANFTR